MKVIAYAARPYEEAAFEKFSREIGIELVRVAPHLSRDTAALARGIEGIAILSACDASAPVLETLANGGTRFIAARTAGFNNIDAAAARRLGLRFSNATYSPHSVADFTVMLMLMALRKAKTILAHSAAQDFTILGTQGREMHNMTVGIVGTGRIGATVARDLTGFGPRLLGYDLHPNPDLKGVLDYVPLDELLARADIVTLHAPLTAESRHLIGRETLARMKDGAILVNCARGDLVDTTALIDVLESGKLSAAALDVIEDERGLFHADHRNDVLAHRELAILRAFPNVIVTPHNAFFTDQAVSDQVEVALRSLAGFIGQGESPWEIKG